MCSELEVGFSKKSWSTLTEVAEDNLMPQHLRKQLVNHVSDGKLPLSIVLEFARWKQAHPEGCSLNEVMRNAQLIYPSPQPTPRSKELEVRLEKLKQQQEEREYKKMVKNVVQPNPSANQGFRAPLITGINFAVTVLACVFASTFVLRNLVPNLLLRLALGFVVGIALLCIEIVLALRAIAKDEEDRKKRS